ncbi:12089_t:CDS:10 [Ambispora leptoticha]|uniref:12089_t:CDS:1 n=1 Tax=Ambispora leptoticha TaxID=144679 RepID=A0A9N8V2R6_9GLOM|nr:12089_t:CDS:10 [Ambispora leptoticha]
MIRHLDIFTNERRLQQQSSLSLLKETRLGIEGAFWLRKLLQNSGKEPATAAIGGIPIGLKNAIEKELGLLKSFGIIPFFVFNGLSVIRKDKPFSTEDTRPSKRAQAWDAYEKGKHDQAYNTWASSGFIHQPDLLYFVFNVLKDNDVEFMRAPYFAWGQKGTCNWLSKKTILNDLTISDEQFLDVCILAGFEYCTTFPPLNTEFSSFTFKSVHDLIKQYKTGFNAVQNYADHPGVIKQNYMDIFCRTRCAIKYHLVLTDEGKVEPLNSDNAPSDIHEFIGYRLPDEIYYYLSKGLMSPQVINTLISGVLIENPPLCNGDTQEYRRFLNELLELRAQAMGLLTQPLHQFYQSRKVVSLYWFEPNAEHVLSHNVAPSVHEILSTWNVLGRGLEDEKKAQKVDIYFLFKVCCSTATDDQAAKTIMPKNNDKLIETREEILANVLWELLQLRKFLTTSHKHTSWGAAFKKALGSSKSKTDSHQEQLFSALELIRFGYLNGNPYSRSYYGSPTVGTEEERKHILLISRTLSMVSPKYQGKPWVGPISRELLAFNSFVKALNRSLRNLCEMLTLSTFLNRDCLNERNDYLDIALSLPFVHDVNTGLGIIAKTYLENIITSSAENGNKISEFRINETLKKLDELFTACVDVKSNLNDGFSFWDEVIVAVKSLKSSDDISNDLASQFLNANQWLSARRF